MRISDGSSDVCSSDRDVAADPRACGDGERACLDVAAERARFEQLHARGRFDVAVQLAGHHHLLALDAAAELGALLDGQVALHVAVALELAGDADVAGAFDLAFARSEERRIGKECVSTCKSMGTRVPQNKTTT